MDRSTQDAYPTSKEIFIHFGLDDDFENNQRLVVRNGPTQADVISAGHTRIRWTPMWSEVDLLRFAELSDTDHPYWLPFARIMNYTVRPEAPAMSGALGYPQAIEPPSEPNPNCDLIQYLSTGVATDEVDVDYTLQIKWRVPPARGSTEATVASLAWSGRLHVEARSAGHAADPVIESGHVVDEDGEKVLKILVRVEREHPDDPRGPGQGNPASVWNSGHEIDVVGGEATSVKWYPVRLEKEFRAYYDRSDQIKSPGTMITGVSFNDAETAGRALLPGGETDRVDGSFSVPLQTPTEDYAAEGELALVYTLHMEEEDQQISSDWDPTIKVKPRVPSPPPPQASGAGAR